MITIVQQYDNYYSKLADLVNSNKIQYALKYGYNYLFYNEELKHGDEWYWHNTLGILKAIEDDRCKSDWIFWTDVDSLIMNIDIDIKQYTYNISDDIQIIASLWITPHPFDLLNLKSDIIMIPRSNFSGTNYQIHTGNFLIRRSKKAIKILQNIYEDKRFRERPELIIESSGDEGAYAIYYLAYPEVRKQFKILKTDVFCTVPFEAYSNLRVEKYKGHTNIKMYESGDFILHALGRWPTIKDIAEWKYNILRKYYNNEKCNYSWV